MFKAQNKQGDSEQRQRSPDEKGQANSLEELGKRALEHLGMLFRPEFPDLGLEGGLVLNAQRTEKSYLGLSNRNLVEKAKST